MDTFPHAPIAGASDCLTPKEAKRFFEFFAVGTHREVLMLGDLVEQPVHYVRSKGHKVLCASRTGMCELCEKSDADDSVSIQQVEYYAPSYVRPWREREFSQRVAVFSAAAGEEILRLIGDGTGRGHRLDVERYSQGNSGRFRIKHLDGLPKGFPAMLPPAFDLVPFVRARFGKRQDAARPLVFLPAFKVEGPVNGSPGRPRALDLTAEDCRATAEAKSKLGQFVASFDPPPVSVQAPAAPAAGGQSAPEVQGQSAPPSGVKALVVEPAISLREASNDELRQEAIRRTIKVKQPPEQPTEASEAIAGVLNRIPKIRRHPDGSYTGPATVPMSNGHHANGGGK